LLQIIEFLVDRQLLMIVSGKTIELSALYHAKLLRSRAMQHINNRSTPNLLSHHDDSHPMNKFMGILFIYPLSIILSPRWGWLSASPCEALA